MAPKKIVLSIVLFLCRDVELNADVMQSMSVQLGAAITYCDETIRVPDEITDQIRHFWDDDFAPTKSLGCLLECAFQRLEIFDKNGNLSVSNGIRFLKANGADDATVALLADELRNHCSHGGTGCAAALAYAKCFRKSVINLQMQPPSFADHKKG